METQPLMAQGNGRRSHATPHRPCVCLEEGNKLRELAVYVGHSSVDVAEYALKRDRRAH